MGDLLVFKGYILLVLVTIDQEITTRIVDQIRVRDRNTLTSVYRDAYPMVEKYILNNSGSKTEAQDIFQDALYVLIKKTADKNFELTAKVSTYLFSVGKNLWLKQLVAHKIDASGLATENEYEEQLDEVDITKLKKVKHMQACITKLGEPCCTIITQFYFLKTPMKRIAEMLHYTNANNAKNQKYKCFMRLKKMVLGVNKGE
ncbi:MAG: sigma-70 family RNA polymerase sigma factor [Crocinitomix sp.]|nr:sigma-70 family RNA polymerase sigma factor [Crocinitomix sp.]